MLKYFINMLHSMWDEGSATYAQRIHNSNMVNIDYGEYRLMVGDSATLASSVNSLLRDINTDSDIKAKNHELKTTLNIAISKHAASSNKQGVSPTTVVMTHNSPHDVSRTEEQRPIADTCPICVTDASDNCVMCDLCESRYHYECERLSKAEQRRAMNHEDDYVCRSCTILSSDENNKHTNGKPTFHVSASAEPVEKTERDMQSYQISLPNDKEHLKLEQVEQQGTEANLKHISPFPGPNAPLGSIQQTPTPLASPTIVQKIHAPMAPSSPAISTNRRTQSVIVSPAHISVPSRRTHATTVAHPINASIATTPLVPLVNQPTQSVAVPPARSLVHTSTPPIMASSTYIPPISPNATATIPMTLATQRTSMAPRTASNVPRAIPPTPAITFNSVQHGPPQHGTSTSVQSGQWIPKILSNPPSLPVPQTPSLTPHQPSTAVLSPDRTELEMEVVRLHDIISQMKNDHMKLKTENDQIKKKTNEKEKQLKAREHAVTSREVNQNERDQQLQLLKTHCQKLELTINDLEEQNKLLKLKLLTSEDIAGRARSENQSNEPVRDTAKQNTVQEQMNNQLSNLINILQASILANLSPNLANIPPNPNQYQNQYQHQYQNQYQPPNLANIPPNPNQYQNQYQPPHTSHVTNVYQPPHRRWQRRRFNKNTMHNQENASYKEGACTHCNGQPAAGTASLENTKMKQAQPHSTPLPSLSDNLQYTMRGNSRTDLTWNNSKPNADNVRERVQTGQNQNQKRTDAYGHPNEDDSKSQSTTHMPPTTETETTLDMDSDRCHSNTTANTESEKLQTEDSGYPKKGEITKSITGNSQSASVMSPTAIMAPTSNEHERRSRKHDQGKSRPSNTVSETEQVTSTNSEQGGTFDLANIATSTVSEIPTEDKENETTPSPIAPTSFLANALPRVGPDKSESAQ